MPQSYPPRSVQRQNDREARRSHSASRRSKESRIRHQPYDGYQAEQQGYYREERHKETSWHKLRGHLLAMFSEFIGTIMFLWFAFAGTQVAATTTQDAATNTTGLVYISLSFGLSLMVSVWAHYRISGGLFNPAVSCDCYNMAFSTLY